jgi:hypothetical protein
MADDKKWPGWLTGEQARAENEIQLNHLNRVAEALKDEILRAGISDSGRLLDSIRVNVVKGEVVATVPYARFLEEGVRPGGKLPPYSKLRTWVGHKLGITSRKQARSVTWAIRWKIQREGIPAKHLIQKAWRKALQ